MFQPHTDFRPQKLLRACLIVVGLPFFVCVVLPVVVAGAWYWNRENTLSTMQQQEVDWILDHAYPAATLVSAEGTIYSAPAGDTIFIQVWVTFDTTDSFDAVRNWYVKHYDGGWGGGTEGANKFPAKGLENLNDGTSGKTRYRVQMLRTTSCEYLFTVCDRPSQQIR